MNRFQYDNIDYSIDGKRRAMAFWNRKPFRTSTQKAEARRTAWKAKTGEWRSPANVSAHSIPKGA